MLEQNWQDMAVKYYSEFDQLDSRTNSMATIRVELSKDSFEGTPIGLIMGGDPLSIEFPNVDKMEAIRGSRTVIRYIRDDNFDAQELYTDQEQEWKVTIYKDSQVIWRGFVIPDGCSEPFMDAPFNITISAVDGLALLKNHTFNTAGRVQIGRAIGICLSPMSTSMRINMFNSLEYEGQTSGTDTFQQVRIDLEQFSGDREKDPMTMYDSLKSILSSWGAVIHQFGGEWYIYRLVDLYGNSDINFFRYASNGYTYVGRNLVSIGTLLSRDGDIIHANADQLIRKDFPYKEVKVRYNYGFLRNIFDFNTRYMEQAIIQMDFFSWDKLGGIDAYPKGASGFEYARIYGKNTTTQAVSLKVENFVNVSPGQAFSFEFDFNAGEADGATVAIYYIDPSNNYKYLGPNGFQDTFIARYFINRRTIDAPGDFTIGLGQDTTGQWNFNIPVDFSAGQIGITFYPAYFFTGNISTEGGLVKIYDVRLTPVPGQGSDGQLATVENAANYTTKPDIIDIYHGESSFDGYVGTMYKSDNTPTDGFTRGPATGYTPFIQIMAEDIMYMHGRPMTIYTGSVYGYFPMLTKVSIEGLSGVFIVTEYEYDVKNNISRVELIEISAQAVTLSKNTVEEISKKVEVNVSDV